ncbi:2-carboxy-1,4-naphthoquinone phytyltransferase [Oscillatoria sp. CS-180]|uniref:2-carboxy-1,4-naphthoquinone phytyltransferase n=1 Tax=Oscillatoria sp. CS-180 TaxID=3021720 RepID=UPI00232F6B12|nr:2-carboxy-1,4-naphthoquinone phytyltransferase [Oscillatoria sp. CS-180]MDB9527352.1 2-carboxy-1,4-naphthoquinone phytyltransferase [Oscillatoria sp. CS-180]
MTPHSHSVDNAKQRRLWLAALKPPMYSVAIMPILVGSAVAFAETQIFNLGIFLTFLVSAVLILIWENLSNDVFDSETGIDVNKAHSLVNLTRNKGLVFWSGNLCLGIGIAGIVTIALQQKDPTVLLLIVLACLLGYAYQGPPFRLGYQGLGEILCFISFGPLGVGAAYYSQVQGWSVGSQIAGIIIGITTSLVLLCSHFHQVEDDIAAGKRSPIVRLGTWRSAWLVPGCCGIVLLLIVFAVIGGYFPLWTIISLASVVSAVRLSRHVLKHHNAPEKVFNAKFYAIGFHFWSGVLLSLGLVLPVGR